MRYQLSGQRIVISMLLVLTGCLMTILTIQFGMDKFLLFAALLAAAAVFLIVRPYIQSEGFTMLVFYVLIASTFFNNALISVNLGFFTLFPYRLMLIVLGIVLIARHFNDGILTDLWRKNQTKEIHTFFIFWLAYGLLSLLWAESVKDGIKGYSLLFMGVFLVFTVGIYFNRLNRLSTFYYIWVVMSLLLCAIGFWNNLTHQHLPSSSLFEGPAYKQHYPTSVFVNQNDFATYLTITVFLFLAMLKNSPHGFWKITGAVGFLSSLFLIFATDSRAGMLGVAVGLAAYFFLLLPRILRKISIYAAGIGAGLGFILFFSTIYEKVASILAGPATSDFSVVLNSNEVRVNLIKNAVNHMLETYGFGVGAGNAEYYIGNYRVFDTENIINVHNWYAEILMNYGFIIFIGYITIYAYLVFSLLKGYSRKMHANEKMLIEALFAGMAAFLVSSISPSSVSNLYFHWVLVAFAVALVNYIRIRKKQEDPFTRS
ncbi:hypothetical protein GKZ89_16685 [Bacillus mangrovi]|uniref:O-antigen ligase-related domain-containing protein n=1 Tax=Metabacillus mangrovi TaxID=1491830 RepID=A0A7X2S7Z2_9BACI|nr:O-antigen ligase family protein [Metabacillus mangrovi]MTH55042.1 hypothetical protein [Metabacillus mangrovi]